MKFYNGHWEKKEGVTIHSPKEIYEYTIMDQKVKMLAPTEHINHRGATLSRVSLTIEITIPMEGVFHIKAFHYAGIKNKGPIFQVADQCQSMKVSDEEECIRIFSGINTLVVHKKTAQIELYRNEKRITVMKNEDLGYIKTENKGLLYEENNGPSYMRGATSLNVGEYIYGLGERFGPLVKNGQSMEMYNEDGGTSTDISYKNVPFFVSSLGYGVFVNHPECVSFEVGSELVKKVSFSVKGESLDFYLMDGPTMKEVLVKYTDLTGKPALPPEWSFGLWLSTSFTTNYDEKTVTEFVDGMSERGITLRVFHFDCFWMKGFHWSNFIWDKDVFPDPEAMLQRLKARKLKICVWINPYISQESELFMEGAEKGYFIKRLDGDVWQWDMWQSGLAIVDLTNPDAKSWWTSKLEVLVDMGVDCFKTDFGERIPTKNVTYFDGSDPLKMHNYYAYLYNETVFELLKRKKGLGEAVVFARSATAGGQKFPVHWGGDCFADYESMAESLRGGLSLTMSGFGYWSHDIGGFEDTSSADVYKRWVAFGLLSTHSRLHGSHSYRVPWMYDEEAVEVLRHFVNIKEKMMPYLLQQAQKNHETGIPVMRTMALEFPDDPNCAYLDRQYMLGDDYLVAPILNEEGMARYYLPRGKWINYFTGEYVEGGTWFEETVDYFTIPLFERA